MAGDFGTKIVLGKDDLPVAAGSVGLILCNYIFMFLDDNERDKIFEQINSVADIGCYLIVELYPAKDSYFQTKESILAFQKKLYDNFSSRSWTKVKYSQQRFVVRKE